MPRVPKRKENPSTRCFQTEAAREKKKCLDFYIPCTECVTFSKPCCYIISFDLSGTLLLCRIVVFFSPPDDIFNSKMLLSSSNLRCFQLNKVSQNPLMSSIVAIKVKEEDKNTQEVTVSLASLARLAWRLLLVAAFYL